MIKKKFRDLNVGDQFFLAPCMCDDDEFVRVPKIVLPGNAFRPGAPPVRPEIDGVNAIRLCDLNARHMDMGTDVFMKGPPPKVGQLVRFYYQQRKPKDMKASVIEVLDNGQISVHVIDSVILRQGEYEIVDS